jgi:hypothetical protein
MSDAAKRSHAEFVSMTFLGTTLVLHFVYRTLSWRSVLFAIAGVFVVSLTLGVAFYLLDVVGKLFARFAKPGPTTDAVVVNIGCFLSIVQVVATIALTTYAFRAIVLRGAVTSN